MNIGKIIFYVLTVVAVIIMICSYMRSEKPVRTAFCGMSSGAIALGLVHFFGGYIGLYLPLNFFTAIVSLILGAPAVLIMTLIEKFL